MNEAKHTPGPWDIAPRSAPYIAHSDNPRIKAWLERSGTDRFDALSVGTKNGSVALIPLDESNMENARLIAAAPYMLEALQEILDSADSTSVGYDMAVKAIAKALGK